MLHSKLLTVFSLVLLLTLPLRAIGQQLGQETISISFSLPDGTQFRAALVRPTSEKRNGWGVLMIGGGMGNDLDWTVPGRIIQNEIEIQITVTGETYSDALPIASKLVEQGFSVMRWSTIAQGDPLEDQWPLRATPRTQAELIEQANAALDELKRQTGIDERRIILLAHSQGAIRACQLIKKRRTFGGFVALSPAYFATDERHVAKLEKEGLCSCETTLRNHPVPTLAVFGELDTSPVIDIQSAKALADSKEISNLTVKTYADLGHQLGQQTGQLLNPMDSTVIDYIGAWSLERLSDEKTIR